MKPAEDLGIDGVKVIAPIGSGGQADVYWARDVDHQREVAVKIFHTDAEPELFDRERKATGLLSTHENVVHLHRSGTTTHGNLFLMMEYADQGSMADHVFSWEEAVEAMAEVAGAVEAAHQKGVIHRDIKPHNVLLFSSAGGGMKAKLADFGIASVPGTKTTTALRGSTAYAPPELLAQGMKTTKLGDIFLLGATAFAALAGEAPPVGKGASTARERGQSSPIGPVWEVVAKAMAIDPEQRYADAEGFRAALTAAAEQVRAAAIAKPVTPTQNLGPSVSPAANPPSPAASQGRSPLWKVPMQLESTRNIAGLSGGLFTSALVVTGFLDPTFISGVFLIPLGYVAGLLISHGFDQD